jgi:hypothetical protein
VARVSFRSGFSAAASPAAFTDVLAFLVPMLFAPFARPCDPEMCA